MNLQAKSGVQTDLGIPSIWNIFGCQHGFACKPGPSTDILEWEVLAMAFIKVR